MFFRRLLLCACTIGSSFCVLLLPLKTRAASSLVIGEVNWAGSSVSPADEWIELWNLGTDDVSLGGFSLAGASTPTSITFPDRAVIPAHGTYLIANYAADDPKSALSVIPELVTSTLSIPNTALGITLLDPEERIVDRAGNGKIPPAGQSKAIKSSMVRWGDGWANASTSIGFDPRVTDLGTPGYRDASSSNIYLRPSQGTEPITLPTPTSSNELVVVPEPPATPTPDLSPSSTLSLTQPHSPPPVSPDDHLYAPAVPPLSITIINTIMPSPPPVYALQVPSSSVPILQKKTSPGKNILKSKTHSFTPAATSLSLSMTHDDRYAGIHVSLRGIVNSPPGLLSQHAFILSAAQGQGLLVRVPTTRALPDFGASLEVTGTLAFNDFGIPYLNMNAKDRWKSVTPPLETAIRKLDTALPASEDAWSFTAVTGTVVAIRGATMTLDVDHINLFVRIRPVVAYRAERLSEGDMLHVQGLLDMSHEEPLLLPRIASDIEIVQHATSSHAPVQKTTSLSDLMPFGAAGLAVAGTEGIKQLRERRKRRDLEKSLETPLSSDESE